MLLSVSDFQGFESYRPSAKVDLPSLSFDNIITIISSESLPCRRPIPGDAHIPFSCPALLFLPIGHRHSFRVQAYSLLWPPFIQHHHFLNKRYHVISHSRYRHHVFTPLLWSSISLLAPVVNLLAAPSASSQCYVDSNPSLSSATFEAQRSSFVHLQDSLL